MPKLFCPNNFILKKTTERTKGIVNIFSNLAYTLCPKQAFNCTMIPVPGHTKRVLVQDMGIDQNDTCRSSTLELYK